MPKGYTIRERAVIIEELKKAAMELMLQKGVKQTTVDELVARVHIPKGTFYLFYSSKELLLYEAIVQKEEELHQVLSERLKSIAGNFTVESLTELLLEFFQIGFNMGILPLMLNGELDVLMRKLPDDLVKEHISKDDDFLSVFCVLFPKLAVEKLRIYSAAFRAIFFTAIYQREIGDCYNDALGLLVKGLVLQMWEEENK